MGGGPWNDKSFLDPGRLDPSLIELRGDKDKVTFLYTCMYMKHATINQLHTHRCLHTYTENLIVTLTQECPEVEGRCSTWHSTTEICEIRPKAFSLKEEAAMEGDPASPLNPREKRCGVPDEGRRLAWGAGDCRLYGTEGNVQHNKLTSTPWNLSLN